MSDKSYGPDDTEFDIVDVDVRQRTEADWNTLALELGDLPPFYERFAMMRKLYRSLPW